MKRYAEALVGCGYASEYDYRKPESWLIIGNPDIQLFYELVQIFDDTLEGRRQADALEDWLVEYRDRLWIRSFSMFDDPTMQTGQTHHQWRLDRIKWCFDQLEKDNED